MVDILLSTALRDGIMESVTFTGMVKQAGIFGSIHLHDGATLQSIPNGSGYTKITRFVDNGESANCTPDVANNKIIITEPGRYKVIASFSYMSGSVNTTFFMAPFLDNAEQDQDHFSRKVSTTGDVGSSTLSGPIRVATVPLDLDVRIRHDGGASVNFTPSYMNLTVVYLGSL